LFNRRPPPKPRYWKALLVTALFLAPLTYFVHFFIRTPPVAWAFLFTGLALAFSAVIYARMQNDWRALGTMNVEDIHRRTTVKRNLHIKLHPA
jgi:hypothetical protein